MRPKLHFANKGFFVLKTMIYVSIKDNAYGFLQGISSTVQAVVSAARDICSLATTQPALSTYFTWEISLLFHSKLLCCSQAIGEHPAQAPSHTHCSVTGIYSLTVGCRKGMCFLPCSVHPCEGLRSDSCW